MNEIFSGEGGGGVGGRGIDGGGLNVDEDSVGRGVGLCGVERDVGEAAAESGGEIDDVLPDDSVALLRLA